MTEVLVTGGAGYIGSHMCVELLQAGYRVVVIDNLSNSSARSLQAVQSITQRSLELIEADLRDEQRLNAAFKNHEFSAVLHFAGAKAVGESVADPLHYYDNNVNGTLSLLKAMKSANVRKLVFSSSATVYGAQTTVPIDETATTGPTNPYGRTKLHIEQILQDLWVSDPQWAISLLRYFNPVGAHESGEIGEDPSDVPNNLMPYVAQVAVGRRPHLRVFGNDYETPDGTGVRDYIHVVDLARGHLQAMQFLDHHPGVAVHNLGTGKGHSVLDVVRAFERASGLEIPLEVVGRRPGDVATSFANPGKANRELDWQPQRDLDQMCQDTWRWQLSHPNGYRAA